MSSSFLSFVSMGVFERERERFSKPVLFFKDMLP